MKKKKLCNISFVTGYGKPCGAPNNCVWWSKKENICKWEKWRSL